MPQRLPLILLPPSEGKAPGGDGPRWAAGSMAVDLDRQRRAVIRALTTAMKDAESHRTKLLGVKGRALEAATAADRSITKSPTMPAIERYTGVLFDALDHRSLTAAQRTRLNGSVVILSGVWGAVMPADPIPDYKLKMGAALPPLGKLSTWWRADLSAELAALAAGRRVWNLLPNEHAAAWAPPDALPQWSVRFLERGRRGALTTVSHDNKPLKGALVRLLLAHPGTEPADLETWDHPDGCRLDPSLTEQRGATTIVSLVRG
jgi:cytoplasmic iron level regulating protein YaaA (DUF328/UPF0246 family)